MNMSPFLVKTVTRTVTENVYSVSVPCSCRGLSAKASPMLCVQDKSRISDDWVKDFVRSVDVDNVSPVDVPPSCKGMQEEFAKQRSDVMEKYTQGCKDQGLLPRMFYFEEHLLKGSLYFCVVDILISFSLFS